MSMNKDTPTMLAVNALPYLTSGSYVDLRMRTSVDIATMATHHFQFVTHRT
jgi:hypothetical protein